MPSQITGDDVLSEHDEDEWKRLRSQITFANGIFWLGFVFAPSSYESRIVRERMKSIVEARGKTMHVFVPQSPDELREAIPWLLDPQRHDAGCVWVEAFFVETMKIDESAWALSWDHVFLRINNQREVFRTRFKGALVFATPHSIKPRIREVAPDTWSVRALVLELSGGVYPDKAITGVQISPDIAISVGQPGPAPDPDFWKAEAERLPPGTAERASALDQAAAGFHAQGRHAETRAVLSEAVQILRCLSQNNRDSFLLPLARSLEKLSSVQFALVQFNAAIESANEAAGILRMASKERPEILHDLSLCLYHCGEVQDALGQQDAALQSTQEAVNVMRTISNQRSVEYLQTFGLLLAALGFRQEKVGLVEEAFHSTLEAVKVFRLLTRVDSRVFSGDFAKMSLHLVAALLKRERFQEAVTVADEAIDDLWPLYEQQPSKFDKLMESLLGVTAALHQGLGSPPDAAFLARKARFAELNPGSS